MSDLAQWRERSLVAEVLTKATLVAEVLTKATSFVT
jgi:hypothetical protein